VEFLSRLRGVQKFTSVGQLIAQMREDVAATQSFVAGGGTETRKTDWVQNDGC
jgi:hypothetical protein